MPDNGVHGDDKAQPEEQGETKACSKCGETKPLTEYYKDGQNKDGLKFSCKVCYKAQQVKYQEENHEKVKAARAKYRAENREKLNEYHAKYYAENRDKVLAAQSKYAKTNPEKFRAKNHRRRAKKRNADGTHTAADWKAKLEYYGYRCRYCGIHKSETNEGWLEADHAIPLSQGGTNWISNIVPACKSCNCSKGAKTFTDFLNGK
jgi:hypothetical protein